MTTMNFDEVWKSVEGTAVGMCKRYNIYGYEWEDLIQEARMELWDTIQLFDENYGVKLNTLYHTRLRNHFSTIISKTNAKKNYYNVREYSKLDDDNIERFVESEILDPEKTLISEETTKEWFDRYDILHSELKKIIHLKIQGYSQKDIATELEYSIGTVYNRFKLMRQFFKTNPSLDEVRTFNKEYQKTLDRNGL